MRWFLTLLCCLPAAVASSAQAGTLEEARGFVEQGLYDLALERYEDTLAQRPDDPDLLIETARVYGWADRHAEAVARYERVFQVAPSRGDDVRLPLAWQLLWGERPDLAAHHFQTHLSLHPGHREALLGLADSLAAQDRLEEALEQYGQMVAADPDDREARHREARTLLWMDRYREAEDRYVELLREDPGDRDARLGLARTYNWSGRHRRAAGEYTRLLDRWPSDPEVRQELATAQRWAGFDELGLLTLEGLHGKSADDLRERIRRDLSPDAEATLDVSGDSDDLFVTALTVSGLARVTPTWWTGASYRGARLDQDERDLGVDDTLYGHELLLKTGERFGTVASAWGVVWPVVSLGARVYDSWQSFAWRARAKWLPRDLWRVDVEAGNEVIENVRSVQNEVTFTSVDVGVDYRFHLRGTVGVGAGMGWFDDKFDDDNRRTRVRGRLTWLLFANPRLVVGLDGLYFEDSDPELDRGYYNPEEYAEYKAHLALEVERAYWAAAARGGLGRLTEDPGSSSTLYFWEVMWARQVFASGRVRLVVGGTDSKGLSSSKKGGYRRTYGSLSYYHFF